MSAHDDIWKALADPTRRDILDELRDGARTTGQLVERFPALSRFAVMKHLSVLEQAGLIVVRREGRFRYNYLNAVPIRQIHDRWVSRFASRWAEAMLDIKRFAETVERGESGDSPGEEMTMSEHRPRILRVEHEVRIAAPRERVFQAITEEIGQWWPHRFRPGASQVVMEPHVGGRFYEDWGDGRGALYAHITCFDPPRRLCTRGPMGLRFAATVVKWYTLEEDGEATILRTVMEAEGNIPEAAVGRYREGARRLLVGSLKPFIEEGRQYNPAA